MVCCVVLVWYWQCTSRVVLAMYVCSSTKFGVLCENLAISNTVRLKPSTRDFQTPPKAGMHGGINSHDTPV